MGETDALDEVALASVNDAIEAVENETVVESGQDEQEPSPAPRNVIPELEDVDDPEEMVEVLLTVGEERSRRADVKGALAAFNKAIALDPSCDMAWFNRGVLLEAQQDARGRDNPSKSALTSTRSMHRRPPTLPSSWSELATSKVLTTWRNEALGFFPGHPALVALQARCKDSGIPSPWKPCSLRSK